MQPPKTSEQKREACGPLFFLCFSRSAAGGDEFVAILQERDYANREALLRLFDEKCSEKRETEIEPWNKVDVSRGMADYDSQEDKTIGDVVRRADRAMYDNKRNTKRQRLEGTEFEA